MLLRKLLLLIGLVHANTSDSDVWLPKCFEETQAYGRADVTDPFETTISDRSLLDNISKTKLGAEARVTFLRYCTDVNTQYVSSV